LDVAWIYPNYGGEDNQSKIRNCIKDYYSNSKTKYVTIFGDADKVPTRYVFVSDGTDNFTATDLYYAALNGTWDDNHDGLYADQRYDNVDAVPEVSIGRIPVETVDSAQVVVDKIENYQQQFDVSQSWTRRIVLAAGTGNNGIEDNQGTGPTDLNEYIANVAKDKEIVKLYEKAGNLSTDVMRQEVDQGALFVNFAGHGSPGSTAWADAGGWLFYWVFSPVWWNGFSISDIQSTTNGARLPVVTACSCSTARFDDTECMGEEFILDPTGGAIAYFGSTRVSYGTSPYAPMGHIARTIYEKFYAGFTRLGQMWQETVKDYAQAYVQNYQTASNTDALTTMEFVLLGDPTLNIHNGPETLKVPEQYATIQGAINDAYDGDTISVAPGVYDESITINKTVSLVGRNRETTVLDAGTILIENAADVTVSNFTLRNNNYDCIFLYNVYNCNVFENIIDSSHTGILLMNSNYNCVLGNSATNCSYGINLWNANNNNITTNVVANVTSAIQLHSSSGNTLSGNTVTASVDGIDLWDSSDNNVLSGNDLRNNLFGISLSYSCNNNALSGNNVMASIASGIDLYLSSGNTLSGNNASNNDNGITLYSSSGNTLSGNVMAGNRYNFFVSGYALSDFLQPVDTSNLVNGKTVYYFVNQSDLVVNADAYPEVGYLGFVNCVNVTVQGMNLTNNGQGLLFANTNDSKITGNNAANNWDGIYLWQSSDNALTGNNATSNIQSGIYLGSYSDDNTLSGNNVTSNGDGIELRNSSGGNTLSGSNAANNGFGIYLDSSGNFIFDNSFVGNTYPVYTGGSADIWNNGSRGNYWSDYLTKYPNATEVGSSGVWNTPYVIDTSNIDHYPLVNVAMVPEFPSPFILLMCALACFALIMASRRKHLKAAE
jgi:parallel beta-helix repeat protein